MAHDFAGVGGVVVLLAVVVSVFEVGEILAACAVVLSDREAAAESAEQFTIYRLEGGNHIVALGNACERESVLRVGKKVVGIISHANGKGCGRVLGQLGVAVVEHRGNHIEDVVADHIYHGIAHLLGHHLVFEEDVEHGELHLLVGADGIDSSFGVGNFLDFAGLGVGRHLGPKSSLILPSMRSTSMSPTTMIPCWSGRYHAS